MSAAKKLLAALLIISLSVLACPWMAGAYFLDDFSGSISSSWTIVRQDDSYYNVQSTYLDLRTNSGDLYLNSNNAKNLFLINAPASGDFIVNMRVNQFVPNSVHGPQFDILVYDDDNSHVRNGYGYIDGRRVLTFARETGGSFTHSETAKDFRTDPFYLRLKKVDSTYTQYYSTDGISYYQSNSPISYGDGTPAKVGFVAMADPYQSSHAYVDYFEVVPAPPSLLLLISGILSLVGWRKFRKI